MLKIGLTGGIGSGKSTVTHLFSELGIQIIDADQIAKEIVTPKSHALQQIVNRHGKKILTDNGELNRQSLRHIIFKDPAEKKWLEHLLHPIILANMNAYASKVTSDYCIFVIPLLVEVNLKEMVDRVLVIDTPESLQISRTMERDDLNHEQANAIVESQATRQQRLDIADDIITNDGDLKALRKKVNSLHKYYLTLC